MKRARWGSFASSPGTPGLEHRIGGLEREDGSGNVSYDAMNHDAANRDVVAKYFAKHGYERLEEYVPYDSLNHYYAPRTR